MHSTALTSQPSPETWSTTTSSSDALTPPDAGNATSASTASTSPGTETSRSQDSSIAKCQPLRWSGADLSTYETLLADLHSEISRETTNATEWQSATLPTLHFALQRLLTETSPLSDEQWLQSWSLCMHLCREMLLSLQRERAEIESRETYQAQQIEYLEIDGPPPRSAPQTLLKSLTAARFAYTAKTRKWRAVRTPESEAIAREMAIQQKLL